eukprot:600625-Rhodomonas_salina.1
MAPSQSREGSSKARRQPTMANGPPDLAWFKTASCRSTDVCRLYTESVAPDEFPAELLGSNWAFHPIRCPILSWGCRIRAPVAGTIAYPRSEAS